MPSGVEHFSELSGRLRNVRVLIAASMPSGVEHSNICYDSCHRRSSDRRLDAFGR